MSEFSDVRWGPTGRLRWLRRWLRRDRLQQEFEALNLRPGSDHITEWRDVPVEK